MRAAVYEEFSGPITIQKVPDPTPSGGSAVIRVKATGLCRSDLRKRGRHVQVGLMLAGHRHPAVPMDQIVANELEILGSHGIQAYKYQAVFEMIKAGKLRPQKLVGRMISLDESTEVLADMNNFSGTGVTVIDQF